MKKLVLLFLVCFMSTGCAMYDGTKAGVSDTYSGIKTVFGDSMNGLGKILSGGGISIDIRTNAAYNDTVDTQIVEK